MAYPVDCPALLQGLSRLGVLSALIPKILHQTWKSAAVPPCWAAWVESWRVHHPGWEHHLWTDSANRDFIAAHYPELLPKFDGYPYAIQRADVIRYCILHHHGGVYVDMDIECLQSIDRLVDRRQALFPLEPPEQARELKRPQVLSNAFMAAPPGHRFLRAIIDRLCADSPRAVTHRDVLATTGPLMLTDVYNDCAGDDVMLLDSQVVSPFPAQSAQLLALRDHAPGEAELRSAAIAGGVWAVHYWSNSWTGLLAGELVNPRPDDVPGYDFHPNLDSPGHDIANLGRDVLKAAEACNGLAAAVAFNTDGFAKDCLLPRSQWVPKDSGNRNEGLYVKRGVMIE